MPGVGLPQFTESRTEMIENINALFDWQLAFAIITAAGAVVGYFITHRRELSWKRTEFICSQLKYLGDDPHLFRMLEILEGRHSDVSINDIYGGRRGLDDKKRKEYQHEFDRFLNYIWCLCFAYLDLKTLTKREIICVGRYIKLIARSSSLVTYCEGHGYERIITVAGRLGYEIAPDVKTPPNKSLEPAAS
jgi:hypothetical protein